MLAVLKNNVTLWDVPTGTLLHTLSFPGKDWPRQVRFSPDGTQLAVIGEWGIQVVDIPSMQVRYTVPPTSTDMAGVAYSPDGRWLASSGSEVTGARNDSRVHVYSAQDGRLVQTIPDGLELQRNSLWFLPDSQHLLIWVETERRSVAGWIWDLKSQQFVSKEVPSGYLSRDAQLLLVFDEGMTVMAPSPANDSYLVQYTAPRRCPRGWASTVLHTPDQLVSVSNTYDELIIWPFQTMTTVCSLSDGQVLWQSEAEGYCVEVAPNNRVVAVCQFSSVQLWDTPAGWKR